MSAAVEGNDGRARRLFLCRVCIASLSSWHALYCHAEAAELESQRRRFAEHRQAVRRVAA